MPESGAVYQPTTVGYAYDARDESSCRTFFTRVMSRHQISVKKWGDWVILLVAVLSLVTGLTTMLLNLKSADELDEAQMQTDQASTLLPDSRRETPKHTDHEARTSLAIGAALVLLGLVLGFVWGWMRFFRHNKATRGGLPCNSGQMLGGLNPSTDLLVGSTSQYGPVLTELPSQLKQKQTNDLTTLPLSDQEEETHTLMQDSSTTGPCTITNQIPG